MNWQKLLGALMIQFMPKMPQIPYPGFNNQPLKGVREGIQYLIIPYKFNQDDYRLKINFPKLEIPFFRSTCRYLLCMGTNKKIIKTC